MLVRLLVFIFALNAFASPAMAGLACDMMNDYAATSMSHDMSKQNMVDGKQQDCMNQDHTCKSSECITNCATSFSSVSFDKSTFITVDILIEYRKDHLPFLYEIFLPTNTRPPLV